MSGYRWNYVFGWLLGLSCILTPQAQAFNIPFLGEKSESTPIVNDLQELTIILNNEISSQDIPSLIQDITYSQLTLQGEIMIGDSSLSDFTTIHTSDDLQNLEKKVREQRELLLFNIENAPISKDTQSQRPYKVKDIEKTRDTIQKNTPKFKSINVLTDQETVDSLKDKTKNNPHVKSIESKHIKSKPDVSVIDNLKAYFKRGIIGSAQASGTWWPNYTSIAFFDTDEVGFAPTPVWGTIDSLSPGARTYHGVDSVYHLAQDGYWVYMVHTGTGGHTFIARVRPTGTGWSGWKMISDSTTDRFPTLMSFRGAIYVGVKNQDGNIYIRHSDDDWNTWTNFRPVGRQTTHGFGIVGYNNNLCVFHKGLANRKMYLGCSYNEWSFASNIWREMAGETNQSVLLSTAFGELWQGHIGTTWDLIFVRSTTNPDSWGGWWQINGGQSPRIFDMTSYNPNGSGEQLCVLISGTDNIVSQTCGRKSGGQIQWHPWQRQGIGSVPTTPTVAGTHTSLFQLASQSNGVMPYRFLTSTASARGYISWMKWNGQSFGVNDTYEQEIYLYSYDDNISPGRKTYLTKSGTATPNCIPNVQYWASNLPLSYLDTRLDFTGLCDNSGNEVSYTIGSASASSIINSAMYFTYWQANKGELLRPIFKVQGQLGYRFPTNCFTTWCSFRTNNATMKMIPINNSNGNWVNNSTQGSSYPYWFQDSWQ